MPYITQENRKELDPVLSPLLAQITLATTAGELNYIITCIIKKATSSSVAGYRRMNEVLGALECAKFEFYRRTMAPYEDTKIVENGDV